jgi:hypothetical protein
MSKQLMWRQFLGGQIVSEGDAGLTRTSSKCGGTRDPGRSLMMTLSAFPDRAAWA